MDPTARLEGEEAPLRSGQRAFFATTRWSLVQTAGCASPEALAALETLARTYWPPLYAYARYAGRSRDDALDLTQGFFAKLLEKEWLASADPSRGRFRTFLLTAFRRFLADEYDYATARKRGGNCEFISLEADAEESKLAIDPPDFQTPELAYEQRWAAALLYGVLGRLREELVMQGRASLFDAFKGFLTGDPPAGGYADVAAKIGMTEGAAKMTVTRLRQRYRQVLRAEIAQTVADPQEVEAELRHLFHVLAAASPRGSGEAS